MDSTGLIILIVTIVAIVAMITWLLVTGLHPIWPKGRQMTIERSGVRIVVITPTKPDLALTETEAKRLLRACDDAVRVASSVWFANMGEDPRKEVDEIGILYRTDDEFDAEASQTWPGSYKGIQAYLSHAYKRLGSGPPLIISRERHIELTIDTGQPVLHEMIHLFLREFDGDADHDHSDKVWSGAGGVDSVEHKMEIAYLSERVP